MRRAKDLKVIGGVIIVISIFGGLLSMFGMFNVEPIAGESEGLGGLGIIIGMTTIIGGIILGMLFMGLSWIMEQICERTEAILSKIEALSPTADNIQIEQRGQEEQNHAGSGHDDSVLH